jgi:carboxylesterase
VLLIHGLTATTAEVRPLAERLNAAGYTVAASLLPGHNTHPDDLNRVHWQEWLRACRADLQRLQADCDQVAVGGESTGAVLSLLLAAAHPEIAALLLYAPALRLALTPLDVLKLHLAAPFVRWIMPRNPGPDMGWQGYTVRPVKGILQLLAMQDHTLPRLAQIAQPLLIVQGRLDLTVRRDVPQMIADRVASTVKQVHWFERSTHCVILDQERDQVAQLTVDFLETVWKVQSGPI